MTSIMAELGSLMHAGSAAPVAAGAAETKPVVSQTTLTSVAGEVAQGAVSGARQVVATVEDDFQTLVHLPAKIQARVAQGAQRLRDAWDEVERVVSQVETAAEYQINRARALRDAVTTALQQSDLAAGATGAAQASTGAAVAAGPLPPAGATGGPTPSLGA